VDDLFLLYLGSLSSVYLVLWITLSCLGSAQLGLSIPMDGIGLPWLVSLHLGPAWLGSLWLGEACLMAGWQISWSFCGDSHPALKWISQAVAFITFGAFADYGTYKMPFLIGSTILGAVPTILFIVCSKPGSYVVRRFV